MSKKFTTIDPGVPPSSIQEQEERVAAILDAAGRGKSSKSRTRKPRNVPKMSLEPTPEPSQMTSEKPTQEAPSMRPRPLTIKHELFTLDIECLEFSVNSTYITVIHPRSVKLPQPNKSCLFELTYQGRTYNVEHFGMSFDLELFKVGGVIFIIRTEETDDQEREIGAGENALDAE